jgi:formate dehydrogenase (coenzyme F420) alpha subunit
MSEEKVEKTVCLFCPPGCGIDIHIKDNKPVKVESNLDSVVGPICIKAEVIPEWYETEAKNRITSPLLRVDDGWKELSWAEALDLMTSKMREYKEKYGPQSVGTYIGQVADLYDVSYYAKRFNMGFGTPTLYSVHQTCYWAKVSAHKMTHGYYTSPTLIGTKCYVVWAANPVESVPMGGDAITFAKLKGAKLIAVDPRRTLHAKAADIHLAVRPGADGALALGMCHVIIKEKLYDQKFVDNWVLGFEEFSQMVQEYTPERTEEITWVPAKDIIAAARMYATNKPSTIFQGNCLDGVENGFYACRAIQALITITGNLDVRGASSIMPLESIAKLAETGIPEEEIPRPKDDPYPLLDQISGIPAGGAMTDIILTGKPYPIKMMFFQRANPILSWADTNKLKKALNKLDFIVVHDLFMTETAQMANLVLPGCTFLEQQLLYQYVGRPMVVLIRQVLDPPGECWPDWKVWFELGKRFGYQKYMPWKSIDEAQAEILSNPFFQGTASLQDAKANPGGVFYAKRKFKKWEDPGWRFATPSGKVELYCERLKDYGLDPLPRHYEVTQSPFRDPELAKRYPLILITGKRSLYYLHGMHRETPSLRARDPEPMAEINTDTARKLGINSGDMVIIESTKGEIMMKAAVTSGIHPKVVSVPHEWGGLANQNILTNDDIHDPAWGGLSVRALACKVRKAPRSQAPQYHVVK